MVCAVLLGACGGGSVVAVGDGVTITAQIGPAGGTLTGPDGVQVVIPAGALTSTVTIGITRNAAGTPEALDAYPAAGPTYEFTPHNLAFNLPVTIRAPLPAGASADSFFMASPGESWQAVDPVVTDGIVEWQRNRFSWMYVGTNCTVPASMRTDPFWCVRARSLALLASDPAQALTPASPSLIFVGHDGTFRLDQAANLTFTSHFEVAGNCSDVTVSMFRRRITPTTLGPLQLVATRTPALTVSGAKLIGTATVSLGATDQDNGEHVFGFSIDYNCPTVLRTNGVVSGWGPLTSSRTMVNAIVVDVNIAPPTVFYAIGGNVSGLVGAGLVLQNNGGNNQPMSANGPFNFTTPVGGGTPYAVTVLSHPAGQNCSVANGSGMANAAVSNVAVTCTAGKAWQTAALLENQTGEAFTPTVAFDGNGNGIALWSQTVTSVSPKERIWSRRYTPSGGWETAIAIPVSVDYWNFSAPKIAFDALGNAIAVFTGYNPDFPDVLTARFSASTSSWGTATLISDNGVAPEIAIDGAGNGFMVWQKYTGGGASAAAAARYNASAGLWGAEQVISSGAGSVYYPQVAADTNGNAVAIWATANGGVDSLRASRYVAGSGWALDVPIAAPAPAIAVSQYRVAYSPAESAFVAVWNQGDGAGTAYSVFTRRLVGGSWGGLSLVEGSSDTALQAEAATDGLGNVTVVWVQQDGGNLISIWARRYTNGIAGSAQRIDNGASYVDGGDVHVASNGSGDTVAVWVQGSRAWSARLAAGASWSNAEIISGAATPGSPYLTRTVVDANGNALVVWQQTGPANDIWANVLR